MKEEILTHINEPRQLEKLYRSNKAAFKRDLTQVYLTHKEHPVIESWHERLYYENDEISWGSRNEIIFVIVASIIGGLIAKIPLFFNIDENFFFPRNIGFIVFPALSAYFAWKQGLAPKKIAALVISFLVALVYINSLPNNTESNTLVLSCIHLVLFQWAILGFSFVGDIQGDQRRLAYLRYNGDLIVMTTLILIAGAIMSGLTIGLFSLIGFHIEEFYGQNVVVFGAAGAPIIGTYLTQTNPQLVGKVSPVIARIFSPLVLVMLVIYLAAIIYSGKDPYNDREFLLVFNGLLIGVMAIIFFSVAESTKTVKSNIEIWVLLLLSAVTVILNGIALSAILFRIAEWGITPNRAAVLGSNVLILINLIIVTAGLYKVLAKKAEVDLVGKNIAAYLPVYVVWTIIVCFLFPVIFGFR